ncbi:hypothetical protein [Nesterenkonia rhizosphaerae]|uniref:TrwC relaxase domain-containing protein n=1 Tax=Nesterenkonia rhizosphaerae TaxID=1348272 RepID=A0ABP9G0E3_9MICC
MSQYAKDTQVPAERSRGEIEKTLERYGADGFAYASTREKAMIEFQAGGRRVRFVLDLPQLADFTRTPTGRSRTKAAAETEQAKAVRQRWRALALLVKAKLEAVESGIVSFETEFMPHTLLPSGRTVAEEIQPQIEQAYTSGAVAPLQIESGF